MHRLLLLALLVSSLICYLEWGANNSSFLFQAEFDVFKAGIKSVSSIIHPFVLLPLAGQVLLLIALLQRNPSRRLAIIGIILLAVLVLLILFVGILDVNVKIIISTLPFLLLSGYYIFFFKRRRTAAIQS